jgi:HTH-type transcriptional regulator / antitoxin HipB
MVYNACMSFDELGAAIRSARKQSGLSQAALAASLGMSRATISGIENGTIAEIGIRKVVALCESLGLELTLQAGARRPTLQTLRERRASRLREQRSSIEPRLPAGERRRT